MIGWIVLIIFIIIVIIKVRIKKRGYFWKAKDGRELSFKQFLSIWWNDGVLATTPLQQKKVALWAYMPIFAGVLWGIVITFIGKTYWLCLILLGSLPITTIQFISTLQQYKSIKKVEEVMKNIENEV